MEDLSKYLPLYIDAIEVKCPKQIGWKYSQKSHPLTFHFLAEHFDKKLIPILRPLSSMTEEEGKALGMGCETRWDKNAVPHTLFQPEAFIKLIEWGFDIFGLKEKGLALYPEDL